MPLIPDAAHAFMPYPNAAVTAAPSGPLAGLTFGVKDLFDVAGYRVQFGGQVPWDPEGEDIADPKELRRLDRYAQFAIAAAKNGGSTEGAWDTMRALLVGRLDLSPKNIAAELEHLDRVLMQFEEFCTVSMSVRQGIAIDLQVRDGATSALGGESEVFLFRGEYLPIVRLHELFGVEPRSAALHEGLVMVVEGDGRRIGLYVDALLGQQQVVIKSLESNYGRIDGIGGATILGEGSVALILDVPGLIRLAATRPLPRRVA